MAKIAAVIILYQGTSISFSTNYGMTAVIALAPKPVLFVVGLSKGYGTQLIDSSLL